MTRPVLHETPPSRLRLAQRVRTATLAIANPWVATPLQQRVDRPARVCQRRTMQRCLSRRIPDIMPSPRDYQRNAF